jgi:hypothetical protein
VAAAWIVEPLDIFEHVRPRLVPGSGEVASNLISVAMKTGPSEAIAWGQLMQDNNGASAMADCRKSLQQDASGRHYCMLPVWTDPISAAMPSASEQ